MKRHIVGVMGGGEADAEHIAAAYEVGRLIAQNGWVLLNGGRNVGVMDASARGAQEAGGLTVGILPDDHRGRASDYLDIEIITGMGSARNNINVLSSEVVIACSGGPGTISEIALALKAKRRVIILGFDVGTTFSQYAEQGRLVVVHDPEEAIHAVKELFCAKESPTQRPA